MIHSSAVIHPNAKITDNVQIDSNVVIGDGVELGEGTHIRANSILEGPNLVFGKHNDIGPNAVVQSHTTMGDHNRVFPFANIGAPPQDLKYKGEASRLEIGNHNVFRESVTLNRGTENGGWLTKIGDRCFLMAYVHIAHDCRIANNVIMANGVQLAGHVEVEDRATLGGLSALAQFCRVGTYAYLGGGVQFGKDVPPYVIAGFGVSRREFGLRGINVIGLKRGGVSTPEIRNLKDAYKILFVSGLNVKEAVVKIRRELIISPEVEHLLKFIETSKQGVVLQRKESDEETKISRRRSGVSREISH